MVASSAVFCPFLIIGFTWSAWELHSKIEFYDCIYSTFAVQSYMRGVWFMQNQNLSNGWLVEKWALTGKEFLPCKWILVFVTWGNFLFCNAGGILQGFTNPHNTPSGFIGSKRFTIKYSNISVLYILGKLLLHEIHRHICKITEALLSHLIHHPCPLFSWELIALGVVI